MDIKVKHGTLTPNTVATVTVGVDADYVEVVNRGEQDIYFRIDGTNPAVDGDDSEIVPAGTAFEIPRRGAGNASVKLVSTGAAAYTVRGVAR